MTLDYGQVATLAAIIRTGSFELAARALSITPSAVSQRIRALEDRTGTSVIQRGTPCQPTAAGAILLRHWQRVELLEADLHAALPGLAGTGGHRSPVRIAIPADALATWVIPALAACPNRLFDVVLDDQDHSAEWLSRGDVAAAITARRKPLPGCDAVPLGPLDYCAVASPAFVARWFADAPARPLQDCFAAAPCLTFNQKDRLQARWLHQIGIGGIAPPTHWLPSSHAFVDAALAGLGWGMVPLALARDHLTAGRLVPVPPGARLQVPQVWQIARSIAPALADVTAAIRQVGRPKDAG